MKNVGKFLKEAAEFQDLAVKRGYTTVKLNSKKIYDFL